MDACIGEWTEGRMDRWMDRDTDVGKEGWRGGRKRKRRIRNLQFY